MTRTAVDSGANTVIFHAVDGHITSLDLKSANCAATTIKAINPALSSRNNRIILPI